MILDLVPGPAAPPAAAFTELADRLARGAEIPADVMLAVLAAAGKSVADLQRECDRRAAAFDDIAGLHRLADDGNPHG